MNTQITYIQNEINQVIKGKQTVVTKVLCAMIAGGHVLLNDIPGVGKTTLAMSISKSMSLQYARIQFTPDVLPSDITGFSLYNDRTKEFEFKQGAVFSNLFLADEINRTSPRTQSALLEVMEEGQVTVDGKTYPLEQPFLVIATQNPIDSSGTQKLPDSQLDRFMICLSLGYPDHENAVELLKGNSAKSIEKMQSVISKEELISLQQQADQIYVHDCIYHYIADLTERTRDPRVFRLGLSPRGSIALLKMAKANAFIHNQDFVSPEDVLDVFFDVACHRVIIDPHARLTLHDGLKQVMESVPLPRI